MSDGQAARVEDDESNVVDSSSSGARSHAARSGGKNKHTRSRTSPHASRPPCDSCVPQAWPRATRIQPLLCQCLVVVAAAAGEAVGEAASAGSAAEGDTSADQGARLGGRCSALWQARRKQVRQRWGPLGSLLRGELRTRPMLRPRPRPPGISMALLLWPHQLRAVWQSRLLRPSWVLLRRQRLDLGRSLLHIPPSMSDCRRLRQRDSSCQ